MLPLCFPATCAAETLHMGDYISGCVCVDLYLQTLQTKHFGWYVRPRAETTSPVMKLSQRSQRVP